MISWWSMLTSIKSIFINRYMYYQLIIFALIKEKHDPASHNIIWVVHYSSQSKTNSILLHISWARHTDFQYVTYNDVQFLETQWWSLVPAWRPTTDAMRRCAAPCCHGYSLGRYSLTAINERLKLIFLHSQLNCCVFTCIFIITSKLYTFFTNLPIMPILKC